ncbi:MAG TPA: 1-deoxy-D-xylulose-5-phosphate synthase N-terminal domain-containing protein, partial [Acidimicrobiales bacterium]|nr:1-deoxy-D-xylulose-5-phosphate synthase N-terminal domain-containing protein [Acidimicrobiales bacterium]
MTGDRLATAVRFLAADMVEAAGSGHPGLPLGMADVATVLFTEHLRFDAADPAWFDRDRFVLSAGHGSALLYALAWLCGYQGVELDHLRRFRRLDSPAAGHPERGRFPGVETTTGPLGQGLATAVGMAIAEARLRAIHGSALCDHHTYVLAGDGCLMEGISHEAVSLAGHLRLDRLIVLWDDNRISIDGATELSTGDDQAARFAASGWDVWQVDGHDAAAVGAALEAARAGDRPALLACRTTIGRGAPTKAGSHHVHGAPLGPGERAAMADALDWPHPPFVVPSELLEAWRDAGRRGATARAAWTRRSAGTDLD